MAWADSSLVMVRTTSSPIILKLFCDTERIASFVFTLQQRNNLLGWNPMKRMGGESSCDLHCHLDSQTEVVLWTSTLSLHGNQSGTTIWTYTAWKIGNDLARAFLMQISILVLPPDFLNSGFESKHNVCGHFHQFSSLTALMQVLVLKCIVDQQFCSCRLFAALVSASMKMRTSVIARTIGGSGFKLFWLALQAKQLIKLVVFRSCKTENSCLQNICLYATSLGPTVFKLFCPMQLILNTPRR